MLLKKSQYIFRYIFRYIVSNTSFKKECYKKQSSKFLLKNSFDNSFFYFFLLPSSFFLLPSSICSKHLSKWYNIIPTGTHRKNPQHKKNSQKSILYRWLKIRFSSFLALGIAAAIFTAIPAYTAEIVTISFPPFELKIPVKSLEIFAKEGRFTPEFAFYSELLKPEEKQELQVLLQKRFDVNPSIVQAFMAEPAGEEVLKRLGKILQTGEGKDGSSALKIAFEQAVADPEGLTIVNLLKKFPSDIILNLESSVNLTKQLFERFVENRFIVTELQKQAANLIIPEEKLDFNSFPDLRKPGSFKWEKQSLTFRNPSRDRSSPADIYLPTIKGNELIPVVVISHGLGSDRNSFVYLAEHLASHGFAIIVPEHIGSSAEKIQNIFAGFTRPVDGTEFINRPLDIKYLLDELEKKFGSDSVWQGRLNFQQVGIVGQSFGGYTALSLAGAPLNLEQLQRECKSEDSKFILNLSLLLQCQTTNLPEVTYNLRDERIKAAIAVNPVSSGVFGSEGISKIEIPMMIVASTEDIFAPAIPEQVYPFIRLTTPDKYLVVSNPATHFSFIGTEEETALELPVKLIGPNPTLAYPYLQALSLAFFKVYIDNQPKFLSYLNESYLKNMNQQPFNFSLLKSLTEADLERARKDFTNPIKLE